jgi:hypothetical protein
VKPTLDEIHEYLQRWYDHDSFSDFNMAWDSGYTDYAAHIIHSAGAIDSRQYCDDENYAEEQAIEKAIEQRMKKYTRKHIDHDRMACFDKAEVYVNPKACEHAFVKNDDVDYLMSEEDMRASGYITADEYYKKVTGEK